MKKLVAGVILLAIVGGLGSAYVAASSSSTVVAQVHVENGSVTVNGQPVTGNVTLAQGDVVRTTGGRATVILYESLLVSLEPDSQVTVEDLLRSHPQMSQQAGRTWNTFTKLSGMSAYSIKWGTTVATVRGTKFEFSERQIVVGEGTVEYLFNGRTFTVTAGRAVENVQNGVERAATAAEVDRMGVYRLRSIQELRHLRQLELDKHPLLVSLATQTYFRDPALLAKAMDDADNGRIDVDARMAQVPVRPASLVKVANITKAIQTILHE